MSHRTEGAVRAESSLFELCRIASEEDEVKSRKSQKVLSSENRAKCIWTMSSREELRWKQIFSHTDRTDHTDLLFMSRRNEGNKGNYFRPRIDRMIRILYLSRKSQKSQKFFDGYIDGGRCIFENKLSPYITHINAWFILKSESGFSFDPKNLESELSEFFWQIKNVFHQGRFGLFVGFVFV